MRGTQAVGRLWMDAVGASAVFALICAAPAGAHEDDGIASDCLETVAEGGRWHIRNGCDVRVHIAWCEEDDGGHCAWKGGPNLEAGGTHSTGRVSDESARFRVAGCRSDFGHGGMWGTPDPNTDGFVCLTPKRGALRLDAVVDVDRDGDTGCLEGVARDGRLRIRNNCAYAVAMAYCDRSGTSAENACGKDEARFFALTGELQPGQEWTSSPWESIEAEACRIDRPGTSPFDPDGWDGRGGFRCIGAQAAGTRGFCGLSLDELTVITVHSCRDRATESAYPEGCSWRAYGPWEPASEFSGSMDERDVYELVEREGGNPMPSSPYCTFDVVEVTQTAPYLGTTITDTGRYRLYRLRRGTEGAMNAQKRLLEQHSVRTLYDLDDYSIGGR